MKIQQFCPNGVVWNIAAPGSPLTGYQAQRCVVAVSGTAALSADQSCSVPSPQPHYPAARRGPRVRPPPSDTDGLA